jgi:hypothetical protein
MKYLILEKWGYFPMFSWGSSPGNSLDSQPGKPEINFQTCIFLGTMKSQEKVDS